MGERARIIIADDDALIRMDLREMLSNLGYLVVGEVGDGRSAVNLARELKPDIVVTVSWAGSLPRRARHDCRGRQLGIGVSVAGIVSDAVLN